MIASLTSNLSTYESEMTAIFAEVLSHELMHFDDGISDSGNPDSEAETIGVAMEPLILTPRALSSYRSSCV
jgi:hypothetical protein